MVEVAKAVRELAKADPKDGHTVRALEQEAMEAVRFLTHCTVRRAYATVESMADADGTARPMPLIKVELRFRGPKYAPGQRTVLWKGGPVLEQLLRTMRWPDPHAGRLARALAPHVAARVLELEGEMQRHVDALKGDPEAVAEVQRTVQGVYDEQRRKQGEDLSTLFKVLVRTGWTEDDVLRVWREEQCRTVQES